MELVSHLYLINHKAYLFLSPFSISSNTFVPWPPLITTTQIPYCDKSEDVHNSKTKQDGPSSGDKLNLK